MYCMMLIGLTAGLFPASGCEQEIEKPVGDVKLTSVKVQTAGGQVMEKRAEDEQASIEQMAAGTQAPMGQANPVVKLTTTMGDIEIELYPKQAPTTVTNFLQYVKDGFYNGTIFHRVMPGFMVQCGGVTPDMRKKSTLPPIVNESGPALRNKRGMVAMARLNAPNSATSQFFINLVDNSFLDFDGRYAPGYAVFGKVIKGLDVVDKIAAVKTKNSQYFDEDLNRSLPCQNVPVQPIVIERVERVR